MEDANRAKRSPGTNPGDNEERPELRQVAVATEGRRKEHFRRKNDYSW